MKENRKEMIKHRKQVGTEQKSKRKDGSTYFKFKKDRLIRKMKMTKALIYII